MWKAYCVGGGARTNEKSKRATRFYTSIRCHLCVCFVFVFFHHEAILIVITLESGGVRVKWLISMSARAVAHAALKGAPQRQRKSLTRASISAFLKHLIKF